MEPLPLKDIHLPEAIAWWPPAPGWWILASFCLLAAIMLPLLVGKRHRRLKKGHPAAAARRHLEHLRRLPTTDSRRLLTELSALLRRVAISCDRREHVASLRGEAWLRYLDGDLPDAPFSRGAGRCLADAHYRPDPDDTVDLEPVLALCERWLQGRGQAR